MPALSVEENNKLREFSVCVVGCGGLGGYIIEMLARLGIGRITLVDSDTFDESNLNRQLLSNESLIGFSKVKAAKERINKINSEVLVNYVEKEITEKNCNDIISNHHIVVDALDNISSRLVLQYECEKLSIPLVHGAISGWYGQVSTILPGDKTLDLLYKDKVVENKLGNPSFTPPIVASIQVSEVIKVLLNKCNILRNKLLMIDLLNNDFNIIELK